MTPTLELTTATAVENPGESPLTVAGTRALSIDASWLRTRTELLSDDVRGLHERTRAIDLDDRAYAKATNASVGDLLDELTSSRGMSWSDVAAAAGVSVSAVRKWRKGGTATAENRNSLGRIAALLDLLEDCAVADPAQWMEIRLPLPAGYAVRPLDLYAAGHPAAVIELAEHRHDADKVLDHYVPGWRDERSDYEVVIGADGERMIRQRSL